MTELCIPQAAPGIARCGDISWEQFNLLKDIFAERPYPRLTYLAGELEIMSPSPEHEDNKKTVAYFLEMYLRKKKIRFYGRGSVRLEKTSYTSGEPDESYCIGRYKKVPDLVLEVIVSSGFIDKLEIYKPHAVPEVWFWQNGKFKLFRYEAGEYLSIQRSVLLPELDFDLLVRCLAMPDQFDAVEAFWLST